MGMRDGEIDDPEDGIGEGFVRDRRKEGGGKTRPKQQRQEDADGPTFCCRVDLEELQFQQVSVHVCDVV